VRLINSEPSVVKTAVSALRIISMGYIFFGVGMVLINAFNGAGDSRTPTWINFFWFWIFQIPFAYFMANYLHWGTTGVFLAIIITETCITITSVILFRRGKWKLIKI
jgi:Na+-driven multidrug efflux pump